ncbi:MAG TPA: hypothetical protein VKV04_08170, partial [Verrucomicrobiae bacterium]|nr:hypothetical protein [Verrucomicrobiae bacterium]
SVTVPNPDNLSAFAAVRSADGKLTLVVINKDPLNSTPLALSLANLPLSGTAQAWQLANSNNIVRLPDTAFSNGTLNQTLPAQSVTLFVLPANIPTNTRPALRFATNNPPGQIGVWLDGQAGQTYALQWSTDLIHWFNLSSNTFSSNSALFIEPMTSPQGFYRGLSVQP